MHKPSLWSCEVPQKNLGPIGLAVLTFIGYKQINKHPNRQAKYMYRSACNENQDQAFKIDNKAFFKNVLPR